MSLESTLKVQKETLLVICGLLSILLLFLTVLGPLLWGLFFFFFFLSWYQSEQKERKGGRLTQTSVHFIKYCSSYNISDEGKLKMWWIHTQILKRECISTVSKGLYKEIRFENDICVPDLRKFLLHSLYICVTMDELLNLSEPQFLHLWNRGRHT